MAGKRYSAGRIFLQVVPSFDNLQKEIEKHVNRANNSLEKKAADDGKRQGEARGKAEGKALRKVRQMSDLEQIAHDDKLAEASYNKRLKDFQKFSQMMIGTRTKAALDEKRAMDRMHQGTLSDDLKRIQRADDERLKSAQSHSDALDNIQRNSLNNRMKDIRNFNNEHDRAIVEGARREKKVRDELDRAHGNALAEQIRRETKAAGERARLQGGRYGQDLRKAAGKAAANIPDQQIGADSSEAERRLEHLRQQLLSLADAKIGVDIDAATAEAKLEFIKHELSKMDGRNVEIDVKVNAAAALAELEAMKHAGNGGGRNRSMFSGLSGDAEDGANSFRIFNFRILAVVGLLPLLTPLLAVAAGGLAALATAAVGAGAGLGVMILGFSGVGNALQAMGAKADAGTKKASAAAKATRNNARGLRDALQGLDQARLQSARAAEDSARRISDAEKRLAETQRDATVAQQRLREARKAAQQDQIDLADKIASGKLDERQALIDLFDAQVSYNNAMQDGAATNKEREQASIDLERARLSIKGIRSENVALAADQKNSTAAGIEGSAKVTDAHKAITDAQRARADAAQALKDAQRDAARSEVDSQRAIRDAIERVADARATAAEGIASDAAAVDALNLAMSKLSPAGQKFATWLFSLREGLYRLRNIAQEGMLPGVQTGLQKIIDKYGPSFFKFVDTMSKVVGDFFIALGDAFTSPVMATFFESMAKYAPDFFTLFGATTINIIKMFAGIMTAFAPYAEDFMIALADLTAGWADWAAGLKDNPAFQEFLIYLRDEGPIVWDMLKNIGKAIFNLLVGMKDNGTIDVFSSFFKMLSEMDPSTLGLIVSTILGLAVASQIASGLNALAISIGALLAPVGLIVLGIAIFIGIMIWLYNSNEDVRKSFDIAWVNIKKAVKNVVDWFMVEMWPTLNRLFGMIGKLVGWLWQNVFKNFFGQIGTVVVTTFKAIGWAWTNILRPVLNLIMDLIEGDFTKSWATMFTWLARMWDGIKEMFARPVNWVIETVLNNGLIKGINAITKLFGVKAIPAITPISWGQTWAKSGAAAKDAAQHPKGTARNSTFATGGWTGPGSKYQPAGVVHADEFVVRKDSQRKMRARFPGLLDHINENGTLPGFAAGGLVAFGRKLQSMGFQVGEHPLFGGVSPVHTKGSFHYRAGAIDVNHDGAGQAAETSAINQIVSMAREYGLRTIWQAAGHFDHAHFDVGVGGDMGGAGLPFWASKPLEFLHNTVNSLMSKVPFHGGFIDVLKAIPGKLIDGAGSWLTDLVNKGGSGDTGAPAGNGGSGVAQWRGMVLGALARVHESSSLVDTVLRRMNQESGGNAKAINLTDSNARAGVPSKGLMQVIDPTFNRWRDKSLSESVWDPFANIVASMRYAKGTYGSLAGAYNRAGGYAEGGLVDDNTPVFDSGGTLPPGYSTILNNTGAPEDLFTRKQLLEGAGRRGPSPLVGQLTIPLHGTNLTPADVSEEILYTLRRIDHGGVYAGRTN